MAGNSVDTLLAWMRDKTRTFNWGAVVAYDRSKTNALFAQQYLRRASSGKTLRPVDGKIGEGSDKAMFADVSQLTFGSPLLSFERANLDDSRASVHLNVMSGSLMEVERSVSTRRVNRVRKIEVVQPLSDFWVTMEVELKRAQGEVGEDTVVIDLGEDGVRFHADFIHEEFRREAELFLEKLYADAVLEARRYDLGRLNFSASDVLAPRSFRIRTQPSSPTRSRIPGSAEYGDGAVVLFVQTKSNDHAGGIPDSGSDFRYLIPDGYSVAVVLSSEMLFDKIMKPYFIEQLRGVELELRQLSGTNGARWLEGTGGQATNFAVTSAWEKWVELEGGKGDWYRYMLSTMVGDAAMLKVPYDGLSLKPNNFGVGVFWSLSNYSHAFRKRLRIGGGSPHDTHGTFNMSLNGVVQALASVDQATGVVNFAGNLDSLTVWCSNTDWNGSPSENRAEMHNQITSSLRELAERGMSFSFPEVNTFALNNLLFPEENAVQVSAAYVPGDLALFGQLDPERTSIRVEPLQASVPGGQAQQFSVHSVATRTNNATWRVVAVDGGAPLGSIDQSGRYQAPPKAQLPPTTVRELVEVTVGAGSDAKRASAMVVLVPDALALNPSFTRVVAGSPDAVSVLASTFGGSGAVSWSLEDAEFGGELRPNGNTVTYTAPERLPAGKVLAVQTIRATVGSAVARCAVLVLRASGLEIEVTPYHVPELAPSASVQLTATYQGESGQWEDVTEHDAVTWSIAGGGGTVSKGRYTAPATITEPYAVVCISVPAGLGGYQYGYAVVQLSTS
ncbi:hypothetical protein [Burkholderia ubonensis]|uniref:hypothetical protein n=3 Tax=Burkholderia ubonensis TaxID=101571 RepID=UPI000B22DDAA|nr:hypothetical protein [Burkholderia ubonensis]